MHIFATGMNPADSNALKRKPRVVLFQAFAEMMRWIRDDGQHAVTWRRSLVGDPLPPGTDAVIVSSMLPRSLNCPYALGVIWTISEALRLDLPLVIYLTDWAFFRSHTEFKSIAIAGSEYFFKKIGGFPQYNEPPEAVERYDEELLDVCRQYADPHSKLWRNARVLVPRYTHWGDVKIVQRLLPGAHPVLTMDPTPLFLRYLEGDDSGHSAPDMAERAKRWILPSLLTDNSWLDQQRLDWPVDRFGPKRYTVLDDEREVQREYRERVGALCPPYPTAGSGWWRSRWIHAARAGTVLLCDSADARQLGSSYTHSGMEYENMSTDGLQTIADDQRTTLDVCLQTDIGVFAEQAYAPFWEAGA